jgi:hypothetical protein
MASKIILSLCDYSGRWPQFYDRGDGYTVWRVDLKYNSDVRRLPFIEGGAIHGILAAPPCTAFSLAGAQYWPAKDASGETDAGLALVDACLRAVALYRPKWWALENPVGRLRRWLGPPRFMFHPHEFAGWSDADAQSADRYTKRTLLWGSFKAPERRPMPPIRACKAGSWIMQLGGKSERTKELRSMTPLGFARAFREANP